MCSARRPLEPDRKSRRSRHLANNEGAPFKQRPVSRWPFTFVQAALFLMRQIPRERRHSSKLSTHDNGEKGRSDMTHARRQIHTGCAVVHIFKGAFVSHKLFPSILLACALFACPALAETGAAPKETSKDTHKPAAPAANNADALKPNQAKQAPA